jgi:hypothetical protein
MFAIAARRMGYRVHTFSPDYDTPTGQVADREVQAAYDDLDAVRDFARGVDVVTFEFENVSSAATEAAADHAPVRPAGAVLHTTQNRLREKGFLASSGFPVTPYAPARSLADLTEALSRLGTPAVLKTAGWGYDGKGQVKIASIGEAAAAWEAVAGQESVLEAFVDFDREVSVVAARGLNGSFACFGVIENRHSRHILDVSIAPAAVSPQVERDAVEIARGILERRPSPRQRARPPPPQLRAPDVRRLRHQPVRAAAPRHLRPPPGLDRAVEAGGHGQPPGRSLGGRRARLARRLRLSRGEASPLWKGRRETGAENGASHRAGDDA